MTTKKTKIKLSYNYAMILMEWLKEILVNERNQRNSFRLVVQTNLIKTVERLHKKELIVVKDVEVTLSSAEALSLQIMLCTRPWREDAHGHAALYYTQAQLPTLPDLEPQNITPENITMISEKY